MLIGGFGKGTVKVYVAEMRLLFRYHHLKDVEDINQEDITNYILFIKRVHQVGRAKCRSVAHSCSFFFKKVMVKPFVLPSVLYPRKEFILPNIMTIEEIQTLFNCKLDYRTRAVLGLLYGSGMRIGEVRDLLITDIDSKQNQILIRQGKGNKDRMTLLPQSLLIDLRLYFLEARPKIHLFESKQTKRAMHQRSLSLLVSNAMEKAGFKNKGFTAHTLRHSFATHLLNAGSDIHTIKTLLGHSKIETTMVYLHLQTSKRQQIVSPLDALNKASNE